MTEGRNWLFNVNDEDIRLSGLRKCIESFMNGSRGRYSRGKWSIANGGYDLEWELYYNNQPFMGKISDEDATKKAIEALGNAGLKIKKSKEFMI